MADVTGPISTLPGALHRLPAGAMCDTHHDRPAVKRVQGETDSFGSEMWDLCQECLDKDKAAPPHTGRCDWCKAPNVVTYPKRDYEEGMYGPVYEVCVKCSDRYNKRMAEEADDMDYWYD